MIWKRPATPAELNRISEGNMLSHLGIVFTAVEPEQLIATMPVDERTKQPHGLLHGGASVVLAESLGSVAGICAVKETKPWSVLRLTPTMCVRCAVVLLPVIARRYTSDAISRSGLLRFLMNSSGYAVFHV